MSKKRGIGIIFILLISILIGITSKSEAETITWIDEPTGTEFYMIEKEDGTYIATVKSPHTKPGVTTSSLIAASQRADDKAKELTENKKNSNDTNNKEEKTELKRTSSSETRTEVTKVEGLDINSVQNKGNIAAGQNAICIGQKEPLAEISEENIISLLDKKIPISEINPDTAIIVGEGPYKRENQKVSAQKGTKNGSFGFVKEDAKVVGTPTEKTLGETYESAAIAYIFSRVKNSIDNSSGVDNPIQGATWKEDYWKKGVNYEVKISQPLKDEADAYQAYRKKVEEFKKSNSGKDVVETVKDTIKERTVGTNLKDREQILRTI